MNPYHAVSTHIQAAVRGRVRSATTVSTTRWVRKAPGGHGHSPQLPLNTAANGVAARENQKAPTGRTSVSRTGSNARKPGTRLSIPGPPWFAVLATAIASSPHAVITACGVQAAYS